MRSRTDSRRTPLDSSYPSCERACAELRIYSIVESYERISSMLALTPTTAQNLGEEIPTIRGTRIAKTTMWSLSSEAQVFSKDIRHHLDWLLELLDSQRISALQQCRGIKMFVCCIWWSACGHGGPTLWPEQMKRLAELNLECSFDVYFFPDESSEIVDDSFEV